MTDMKLRELLVVIDDHYGRARSLEERREIGRASCMERV